MKKKKRNDTNVDFFFMLFIYDFKYLQNTSLIYDFRFVCLYWYKKTSLIDLLLEKKSGKKIVVIMLVTTLFTHKNRVK